MGAQIGISKLKSLIPKPAQKIRKKAWSHLTTFPYVLSQRLDFGLMNPCSSITNCYVVNSVVCKGVYLVDKAASVASQDSPLVVP